MALNAIKAEPIIAAGGVRFNGRREVNLRPHSHNPICCMCFRTDVLLEEGLEVYRIRSGFAPKPFGYICKSCFDWSETGSSIMVQHHARSRLTYFARSEIMCEGCHQTIQISSWPKHKMHCADLTCGECGIQFEMFHNYALHRNVKHNKEKVCPNFGCQTPLLLEEMTDHMTHCSKWRTISGPMLPHPCPEKFSKCTLNKSGLGTLQQVSLIQLHSSVPRLY